VVLKTSEMVDRSQQEQIVCGYRQSAPDILVHRPCSVNTAYVQRQATRDALRGHPASATRIYDEYSPLRAAFDQKPGRGLREDGRAGRAKISIAFRR